MKALPAGLTFVALTVLSGCQLAEGLVKFGFWGGVVVVAIVLVLFWVAMSVFKRRA